MSAGGRGPRDPPWKRVLGTRVGEEPVKPPLLLSFPLVLHLDRQALLNSHGISVWKG